MKTVQLYGIEYPAITLRLEGLTPLLMHNAAGQLGQPSATRRSIPTPEEEAERGTYRDADGNLVFPTSGIRSSILKAAGSMKSGKKAFSTILAATLFQVEEWVPVLRNGEHVRDYAVDVRRVVVQKNGILRARPRIDTPWGMEVTFALDITDVQRAFINSLLEAANIAGRAVGIGDYRPEKRGLFGRYRVELVE
ncbi:MAG: hypothetical protein N2045_14055 [Fimbriimonadales bacterium]|nr:hypothetical protein [Fimbriimonadales bacterium]